MPQLHRHARDPQHFDLLRVLDEFARNNGLSIDEKVPVYEELIQFLFRIVMSTKTDNPVTEDDIIAFMSKFTEKIMVWGSDDVIDAWAEFRNKSAVVNVNPAQVILSYEDLIKAIRRDLGHANKNLGQGRILSLFVNDIEAHLKDLRSPPQIESNGHGDSASKDGT